MTMRRRFLLLDICLFDKPVQFTSLAQARRVALYMLAIVLVEVGIERALSLLLMLTK